MLKREVRRFIQNIDFIVQPVLLVTIFFVLGVSTLSLINLSPITTDLVGSKELVLGVSSDLDRVEIVGGQHRVITQEELYPISDGGYLYRATFMPHEGGDFNKPALRLVNPTDSELDFSISMSGRYPLSTQEVSLIVGISDLPLRAAENGQVQSVEVAVQPGQYKEVYLQLSSEDPVHFTDTLELSISN